jgi:hypothetical protein
MTSGTLFFIIAITAFVIFATQAGARESKFLSSPIASILFAVVVGTVLYFIWWSGSGVFLTH